MSWGRRSVEAIAFAGMLFASACTSGDRSPAASPPRAPAQTPPASPAPAPSTDADSLAIEHAREAASTLGRTLKTRLLAAMAESGPIGALEVCSTEAQLRTREVGEGASARVGRSSLRLRNEANTGPDWVRDALSRLGERPAAGVQPIRVVVEADGRRVARFAAPIAVEGPCLTCHGPRDSLAPDLREALARRYPNDRALGYAVGDLRGLVWAEVDVR